MTSLSLLLAAALAAVPPTRAVDAPIADAAMRGDTAGVRRLIAQRANVNAAQGDGMTALHWAAQQGNANEIRLLVGAGAKVDATTRNGSYTPLHLAARNGRGSAVRALIRAGANVNAPTSSGGAAPIHFAAGIGDQESIVALLEAKAGVNTVDSALKQTPLMWATAANRLTAIKVLLAHGADVKITSRVDSVAAKEAADRAATQAKRRILYPNLAAQGGRGGNAGGGRGAGAADSTPRDSAAAKPDSALAAAIASSAAAGRSNGAISGSNGNDPTAQNQAGGRGGQGGRGGRGGGVDLYGKKGGLTALAFAAREGHTEAAMTLLDAGADINQVSAGDHSSPLLLACINGHFDLAMKLLERGANPNLVSDAGAGPLYTTINVQWAAKSLYPQPTAQLQQKATHLELMEALLQKGADPNVRLKKHLWYMSYNFDLLGVNTTGATPFWRAAYGTDVPAMRLLKKYGADPLLAYTTKTAGRLAGADAPVESDSAAADPSGIPPVPNGGPGVLSVHAASGVGYGEGYAANSHNHAPDGWLPAMQYLIDSLHFNVNARDQNGYTPLHHAAARGDNELIKYLVSRGADVMVISRRGQTTVDMANGPVQRVSPFPETIKLLESLGAKNSNKCRSCSP